MTNIQKAKEIIADSNHLVVLTGAGISAESGVPTFRDALTGLWSNFDPQELATASAFIRDPELVWGWYEWRRKMLLEVAPNPAHIALSNLENKVNKLTLITQNVDDLHERAGSKNVLHLHGSMFTPRCFDCGTSYTFTAAPALNKEQKLKPPKCSSCNGNIRPGVVWFGEAMPQQETIHAFEAANNCDVFLSIGTSGLVYPAAGLPEEAARNGANVIHINPQTMAITHNNEMQLMGNAAEILPKLI